MTRIYLTHCCKDKADYLEGTDQTATPDELYVELGIQSFMGKCKEKQVHWAILSDLYGVYLPHEQHEWYEKHPDTVTSEEAAQIISDFDSKLRSYDEIFFYIRPDSFHPFYAEVLSRTNLESRVRTFQNLEDIE